MLTQTKEIAENLNDAMTALVALHNSTLSTPWAQSYAEAIRGGALAFDVQAVPLVALDSGEAWYTRGTRNAKTGKQLGCVGPDYRIVQNTEVGATLDEIMKPLGGIRLAAPSRMRAFDGGRVCSLLLDLPPALSSLLRVRRDDSDKKARIVVKWSHDGSTAITAEIATFRALCENGLMLRKVSLSSPFRMKHTKQIETLSAKMAVWLKASGERLASFGEQTRRFDRRVMGSAEVNAIIGEVFVPESPKAKITPQAQAKIDSVIDMVEHRDGRFVPAGDVTAYTLLEAFTAYDAHLVPVRGQNPEDRQARRELNVLSGFGVAGRAWEILDRIS
jgi:hypothetical protein